MKREILFRGQSKITNEWNFGDLIEFNGKTQIIKHYMSEKDWKLERHSVTPETVGQFAGTTDKNGTKIFEGDLCVINTISIDKLRTIVFKNCGFTIEYKGKVDVISYHLDEFHSEELEIKGNIHNPELL